MNVLLEWLATLYAYLAVVPFAAFLLVWGGGYAMTRDHKQPLKWSMDTATFFLVGAVAAMYNHLFHVSGGFWIILLLLLIGAGLIGSAQQRLKGEVDWTRTTRAVWRIAFFLLSMFYIIFFIVGLARSIGNT